MLNLFSFLKRGGRTKIKKRQFSAAEVSRLSQDWVGGFSSASEEVRGSLRTMRNRGRELERDHDYAKRYFSLLVKNVVGAKGFQFQAGARRDDGSLDKSANDEIEAAFKDWSRMATCTVTKNKTLLDVQKLGMRGPGRDGETIIHTVFGFANKYKFALQLMDPDLLDEKLNRPAKNGQTRIRMGVEFDEWSAPINYWFLTSHPGGQEFGGFRYNVIAASNIIHAFIEDREGQGRGVPMGHTAMRRMRMLQGYEEAELIAARVSASKLGFLHTNDRYPGDGEDVKGNILDDAEPGHIQQLPEGMEFSGWDPQHPNSSFSQFIKWQLRGAAAGLDVNYNKLANDLEGVNFSSLRAGEIDERDGWMVLQAWMTDHIMTPIYEAWLQAYLMSGLTRLPFSKFERFREVTWQGRRWMWVDPLKQAKADVINEEQGWKSTLQIIAENGNDAEQIAEDEKRLAELQAAKQ